MRRVFGPIVVAAAALTTLALRVHPTAATSATAPTFTQPVVHVYRVRPGDSLFSIARFLQVSVGELAAANNFSAKTLLVPGQTVIVPSRNPTTTSSPPNPTTVMTYTVAAGDSLTRVAPRLGVTLAALLATNRLTSTSIIHPGQTLAIPVGGHPATPRPTTSVTPPPTTTSTTTTIHPGPPAGTSTYTVRAGDSLTGIARRANVTLSALLAINNLSPTALITPGQVLTIPTPTPTPSTHPPATTNDTTTTAPSTTTTTPLTPDSTTPTATPSAAQQQRGTLIAFLRAQIGKPYVFNTAGPDSYDCSGLVTAAFAQIGIHLPHQSALQSTYGTHIDWTTQPLLPGDLIFQTSTTNPTTISHVGIVIDATHWIDASRPGTPVSIKPTPATTKIAAVRRILTP